MYYLYHELAHAYQSEDLPELQRILAPGTYHAVVANPPYITVKDKALNQAYRERYHEVCHRQYSTFCICHSKSFSFDAASCVQDEFYRSKERDSSWASHPGGQVVQTVHAQLTEAALRLLAHVIQRDAKLIRLAAALQWTGQQIKRAQTLGPIVLCITHVTVDESRRRHQLMIAADARA